MCKKHTNVSGQAYNFPEVKLPRLRRKTYEEKYDIRDIACVAWRFKQFERAIHRLVILQTMYGQKKNFSTFSYKLVQISPIMILVNSGAFLSISSWFCELTELIFVMIPYISSTGYPPKTQGIMGHVH